LRPIADQTALKTLLDLHARFLIALRTTWIALQPVKVG
jgi:hypothetical protein